MSEDRLAQMQEMLTSLIQMTGDIQAKLNEHDDRFAQIDQRFGQIDRRFEQIDQRFGQIDQRFEQIDQRFGQIDQRFEQIDQRFGQIDWRFEQIDRRFEQMDERFTQLDQRIGQVETMTADLIKMVGTNNAKLIEHDQRLERLEQKLDAEIELNKVRHQELLTRYKGEMDILWQKEAENEREIARFKKLIGL